MTTDAHQESLRFLGQELNWGAETVKRLALYWSATGDSHEIGIWC